MKLDLHIKIRTRADGMIESDVIAPNMSILAGAVDPSPEVATRRAVDHFFKSFQLDACKGQTK